MTPMPHDITHQPSDVALALTRLRGDGAQLGPTPGCRHIAVEPPYSNDRLGDDSWGIPVVHPPRGELYVAAGAVPENRSPYEHGRFHRTVHTAGAPERRVGSLRDRQQRPTPLGTIDRHFS